MQSRSIGSINRYVQNRIIKNRDRKQILDQVSLYLETYQKERINQIPFEHRRSHSDSDFSIFRYQERCLNNQLILQYMVSFLKRFPSSGEIQKQPVNPLSQFREFIEYDVNLLTQEDVQRRMVRDLMEKDGNGRHDRLFYRDQIRRQHSKLLEELSRGGGESETDVIPLADTLRKLLVFWFFTRDFRVKVIRKGDIYTYMMNKMLRNH